MSENLIQKIKIKDVEYDLGTTIDNVSGLQDALAEKQPVGDYAVYNQITEAIDEHVSVSGHIAYAQNDEPVDAPDGALWIDMDTEGVVGGGGEISSDFVQYTEQSLTEKQKAQARSNIGAVTVADVLAALPTWEGGSY